MGTVMYECGCFFSHSMFGDRQMMALNLCSQHIGHPKVQEAAVKDLQHVILKLRNDEPLQAIKVDAVLRSPPTSMEGAGCLL